MSGFSGLVPVIRICLRTAAQTIWNSAGEKNSPATKFPSWTQTCAEMEVLLGVLPQARCVV
jgi:hypothetical protein